MQYQPYYYQQPMAQPMSPQISNGFVSVRNELEARNYPVAYGNSVTFKDENAPYVYTKTMGFSQLETPKFEKFKLVKEEPIFAQNSAYNAEGDDLHVKDEISAIWREIRALKSEIFKQPQSKKKKEVVEDDKQSFAAIQIRSDADSNEEV